MPKNVASVLSIVICTTLLGSAMSFAQIAVLDASYRPDRMLPEFNGFWKSNYRWGDAFPPCTQGGSLVVYFRNTGATAVTVDDFIINGTGLKTGIGCDTNPGKCDQTACSVYYPPPARQALINAGEPVWWRKDPYTNVPPGACGEIFVRMRYTIPQTLSCSIVLTSGSSVPLSINVSTNQPPRIAGYAISPDSTKLYLYLRHPTKGKLPIQILVDGIDKTSSSTMVGDPNYDLVAVSSNLGAALARGSFHCFQAIYDDGTQASFGCRVYHDDFKYGVWGAPTFANDEEQHQWWHNLDRHSVNFQKGGQGGWYRTADARAHFAQVGFKFIHEDPTTPDLYSLFLCDEPDAGEGNVSTNVCPAQVGAYSQSLALTSQSKKTSWPQYPTNLNLNGSFKPYNYYNYGHVADVLSVDPYYQTRIVDAYWDYPTTKPFYTKATYIYAVASTCQSACEPRRLHIILNSCRKQQNDEGGHRVFRWGTPEEKRIEVYYAVAAGAKEIAYWWMTPVGINADAFCGIGWATEPGSAALWREMGLLGAEVGIASPVLVNSCPVSFPVTKSGKLWVRALLSSTDTIVLLCVNDDYANTDSGTAIESIYNAQVSFDLPAWLTNPTNVFDVSYKGIQDVSHNIASGRITLDLGKVDVTRMVIVTKDTTLKSTLQLRYTNIYLPRITQIIPLGG